MTTMTAIVRNGQIELPSPIDLPDGTVVEILLPAPKGTDSTLEEDSPMTPEEIARTLASMDAIEPFEMTEEEEAAFRMDRQTRKEREKANFDERAEKLQRIWE